jgi:hypothetical protein
MIGRKNSLLLDCFAFFLGFFLYGAAENVETMCVARALLGYPLVNTVSEKKERERFNNNCRDFRLLTFNFRFIFLN